MAFEKIMNINDLREKCSETDDMIEGFIHFGIAKSSKRITYDENQAIWYVYNEIDDSEEEFTEQEFKHSTTASAIRKGAFFLY